MKEAAASVHSTPGQDESNGVFGSGLFQDLSYYLAGAVLVLFVVFLQLSGWGRRKSRKYKENGEEVYGLEAIPGPRSFPVIGNVFDLYPLSEMLDTCEKIFEKYGPTCKLTGYGKVGVFTTSTTVIQTTLKSTDFGHLAKSLALELCKPYITNGVLVSNGKLWQTQRKILLRSMSNQNLRGNISMLNTHFQRFISSVEKRFSDGKEHTMYDLISTSFLEAITEMLTGVDALSPAESEEYLHNFETWKNAIIYRLFRPWFLSDILWKMYPFSWKVSRATQRLIDFARKRVGEHKRKWEAGMDKNNNNQESTAFSTAFQNCILSDLRRAGVSEEQIIDEFNTLVFGGHDTGACAIHFFCFAMALNPEIQKKCRKEIDEIFQDPMIVQDGRMSYESLGQLKYLERCILETLRLFPPGPIFIRELKSPLRTEVNGKTVELPIGSNVVIFAYFVHRNPEYFPDPERFDPDRFLPEICSKRPVFSFLSFSGGPRGCLGIKLGMIEMKMIAAYLLRNFYIDSPDSLEDIEMLPNLVLTPHRDMNFSLKKRVL